MLGMTGFRLVNAPTFVPAYLYILASHGLGFLPAGLRMLVIGLAMKVLIADPFAPLADAVFDHGHAPGLATAWIGVTSCDYRSNHEL